MRFAPALTVLNKPPVYIGVVVAVLVAFAGVAIAFGYISWDSYYYISLAQSLREGQGCSIGGSYSAAYPCGYPAILALTAPVANLAWMMVSSKIANLILLTGTFAFVYKASKHILMATLVVLNPVTLLLFMYTWSENLELFCFAGTLFAVAKIHAAAPLNWRAKLGWPGTGWYVLLAAILVLGCFTRYFFGPFAVFLFAGAWIGYGRRTALRVFPCFCIAGAAYIAYHEYNIMMTGFGTGMGRVAAPEAFLLLVRRFIEAVADNGWGIVVVLILLAGLAWKNLSFLKAREDTPAGQASLFVLTAGLGFLALAFYLRAQTFFDPYNTRTVGLGVVLAITGLSGRFLRLKDTAHYPLIGLLAATLFTALITDDGSVPDLVSTIADGDYSFPPTSLGDMQRNGPDIDAAIYFEVPTPDSDMGHVDVTPDMYYGPDVDMVTPNLRPAESPDTAKTFIQSIRDSADGTACIVDFKPFDTAADFQAWLNASTLTDRTWSFKDGRFHDVTQPNMDPSLRAYLAAVFQPGREVPCSAILALPVSRAL